MQPLPYYTIYVQSSVPELFSMTQLNWFVVLVYIASLLLTLQLVLAVHNCYAFLYKQRKYKTLPLMLFYTLAIMLTLARLSYDILQFGQIINQWIIYTLMPIIKINMGLNQCWMLYELSLRVSLSIKLKQLKDTTQQNADKSLATTEKIIKIGRIVLLVFVPSNLIFLSVYILVTYSDMPRDESNTVLNRWNWYIGIFFYILFVMILLSVVRLIRLLKRMRDCIFTDQTQQVEFFNREIRTLWVILITFNCSYLLRGIWDQVTGPILPQYSIMMLNICTGLLFDCFPVSMLLYFHYRNFKSQSKSKQSVEQKNKSKNVGSKIKAPISLSKTDKSLNMKSNQGRLAPSSPTLTTNELFRTGPIYQASSNSGGDDSSSINMVTHVDYIESDESVVQPMFAS